jgi:PAP_fibrillin
MSLHSSKQHGKTSQLLLRFYIVVGCYNMILLSSTTFVWSFMTIKTKNCQQKIITTASTTLYNENKLLKYSSIFFHDENQRTTTGTMVPQKAVLSPTVVIEEGKEIEETTTKVSQEDEEEKRSMYKAKIFHIADRTKRGFQANNVDRTEINRIVKELSQLNPTKEPARSYYIDSSIKDDVISVKGKWTLIYTDAPDITTLDQNPLAKLGRIGQLCSPPYIKNVIEYRKPSWTDRFPLIPGTNESRVLQKVVTKASASSNEPTKVKLLLSGLQFESNDSNVLSFAQGGNNNSTEKPMFNINGPIDVPFGNFEILYLDQELRIIRTFQNYLAINVRQKPSEEWF